jgi:hypothetical protein
VNTIVLEASLPEDGQHGAKKCSDMRVMEEIIIIKKKNFVAIDSHHDKVLVTNATRCNLQK